MLKHPFAGQPLAAITLDIPKNDLDYLTLTLSNRGDKLCLVNLLHNFTNDLRAILTHHPELHGDAARIGRILCEHRPLGIDSHTRAIVRLTTSGTPAPESEHLRDDRRSDQPQHEVASTPDSATEPTGEPRKRRREAKSKAPKAGVENPAKSRGHRSRGA